MALLALCKGGNRSRHSFKNSDESNLLLLLFQEEQKEGFTLLKEQITLSLFLSQKTSDSHEKSSSEFPTLIDILWTNRGAFFLCPQSPSLSIWQNMLWSFYLFGCANLSIIRDTPEVCISHFPYLFEFFSNQITFRASEAFAGGQAAGGSWSETLQQHACFRLAMRLLKPFGFYQTWGLSKILLFASRCLSFVGNLLFCSLLFLSKSLMTVSDSLTLLFKKEPPQANRSWQKSDREHSFRSLMTKEQPWANRSHRSVKKTTWGICCSHKRAIRSEKFMFYMFFTVFHCFSSFLCPRVKCSHCSLLSCSFLKSSGSDLLSLLWTNEQPWGNCSHHSLKRLTVSGSLFFWANHTFAHIKPAIRSKNQWANSQPWTGNTSKIERILQ